MYIYIYIYTYIYNILCSSLPPSKSALSSSFEDKVSSTNIPQYSLHT